MNANPLTCRIMEDMKGLRGGLALLLLVGACTNTVTPTTSTTAPPATTTSVISSEGREVRTVECSNPPAEVAILCEVYVLVTERYVDERAGADLAVAAGVGVEALEPTGTMTDPLVCAIPTPEFVDTCLKAAKLGLDSEETAEVIILSLIANSLDPNTVYLDPDALSLILQSESGQVEGIGAHVTAEDETITGDNKQCSVVSETCRLMIVDTLEGAPARAAGILANDVLLEVDGLTVIGRTVDEVVSMVRGPSGTGVNLTFDRQGEVVRFSIVRARVEIPVLTSEIVGTTGYVRLFSFSDNSDERFEQTVLDLIAAGVERLVIDFRGNPGGFLTSAVGVASVFLPDGKVVTTEGPEGTFAYEVTGASIVPEGMPVHVVVNRGSASASEVVVGVLQERGRVTAFGENTFGKNTVQQRFNLSNGGAVRLTTARWLTPGGLDFGGAGLPPDVIIEFEPGATPAEVVGTILASMP